jgi:hypothetical protein
MGSALCCSGFGSGFDSGFGSGLDAGFGSALGAGDTSFIDVPSDLAKSFGISACDELSDGFSAGFVATTDSTGASSFPSTSLCLLSSNELKCRPRWFKPVFSPSPPSSAGLAITPALA